MDGYYDQREHPARLPAPLILMYEHINAKCVCARLCSEDLLTRPELPLTHSLSLPPCKTSSPSTTLTHGASSHTFIHAPRLLRLASPSLFLSHSHSHSISLPPSGIAHFLSFLLTCMGRTSDRRAAGAAAVSSCG